jgi:TolB-like protein/DNA-binding winged helix-turn-helix (wHTH) protein
MPEQKVTTREAGNSRNTQSDFFIADWRVEPEALRIFRANQEVRLEPRVMQVLVYLAGRPGEVVSREDLEANVWTGRVVGYDAVSNTVIKLRKAFGDSSRNPQIIETIPKTGYRLIARVERSNTDSIPLKDASNQGSARRQLATSGNRRPILTAAGVLVILAIGMWFYLAMDEKPINQDKVLNRSLLERPSIAVLPFWNVGNDPNQEYFSDGITEDLITDLSQIQGLDVVARNSVFAYKRSGEDVQIIGQELGVLYVLKGTIQRSMNRLRFNVQLIDVADGRTLWAKRYDRELGDIFSIQDELAAHIVSAMEVELAPADRHRLDRNYVVSIESYDEFLKGLDHYGRGSFDDNLLAKAHYSRAIELDPGFARAYAGLAQAYTRDSLEGWEPSVTQSVARASDLAQRALKLDDSIPQLYFVTSQVKLFQRDYSGAINSIQKAIELNPSYADGYALMAWILQFAGRPKEGLRFMERAIRLNPRIPAIYRLVLGSIHYSLGNLEQAAELLRAGSEISPNFQQLRVWLAAAYAAQGLVEEANWEAAEILTIDPSFSLQSVETAFPFRDPLYRERFIGDLKSAGLHYR